MRLLDNLLPGPTERRSFSFQDYVNWFAFQGQQYGLGGSPAEFPADGFENYIQTIHRREPNVSAAAVSRALLISQLRFQWRDLATGKRFGSQALLPLEQPGSMSRTSLLHLAEIHASYAGSAYFVRKGDRVSLLRPDWVQVVIGTNRRPLGDQNLPPSDAEIIGLIYEPEHDGSKGAVETFQRGQFAIWTPEPDPVYWWHGSSWVTSLFRDLSLGGQVHDHQRKFFEHAATPNLVFTMDPNKSPEQVREYAAIVNKTHAGAMNAYKNMFLGGGTDVKIVGSSLENMPLKDIAGGIETHISTRSMVPPVILHIREGMQGSSLTQGNYGQTRRLWADKWFTPTSDGLCEALASLLQVPDGVELTWDRSRVMFLQEDEKDAAEIRQIDATTVNTLITAGYEPDSVTEAVTTGDFTKLVHTGNVSVQLQPPGANLDA